MRRSIFLNSLVLLLLQAIMQPVSISAQESIFRPVTKTTIRDTGEINILLQSARDMARYHPDSALLTMELALQQSCDRYYEEGVQAAASYLSNAYAARGMTEQFAHTFKAALAICERNKMNKALPQLYTGIGYTLLMKGMNEEAIKYYYQAIAMAEKYSTPVALGRVYNNIASALPSYWSVKQAMFYLDKAEKIALEKNSHELLVYTLINKGYVYIHHDETDRALFFYKRALGLARKHGLTSQEYLILTNMGGVSLKNKKPREALTYLLEAQSLKGNRDPAYQCLSFILVGNAYLDLREYTRAEYFLLKTIQTTSTEKVGMMYLPDAHESLAKVYNAMGNYKQAYLEQRQYSLLKDSLQREKMSENVNQLEVKYRTAQKDKEIILNQLKISRQENFIRKKNIWIGGVSSGALFLIVLFLSFYRTNRHKRRAQSKQIQFLQQEQEALQHRQAILNQKQEINQLRAVIEGEEKERSRIGRELHDGIGGMLSAINMNLNAIQKRHPDITGMKELNAISRMLDDTSTEVRKTAHNLMPDVLIRHSLKEALIIYCEHLDTNSDLQIDLQIYGNLERLGKGNQLTLYRIIQELMQNIIRHACATHAVIQIMQHEEKLSITVEDNGIGFNKDKKDTGYGLQNLEFRVRALKGEVSIMSSQNKGTTVYMVFEVEQLIPGAGETAT